MRRYPTFALFVLVLASILPAVSFAEDAPKTVRQEYPLLSTGPLAGAKLADLPEGVLLKAGDLELKQADVDAAIKQAPPEFQEQLKKNQFFILEQKSTGPLLAKQARADGFEGDDEAVIRRHLQKLASAATVDENEVKGFYDANQALMKGAPFEQVQNEIRTYLANKKKQEIVVGYVKSLTDKVDVKVSAAWTKQQAELALDNAVDKARASGKPTFVSFGAQWCGPCKQMAPIRDELAKKYEGKITFVHIDIDKEKVLGIRYGAEAIPLMFVFDAAGKESWKQVGATTKEALEKEIEKVIVK